MAGALDGRLYIYDAASGEIVWQYDTLRDFPTLNGIEGKGGSIESQSVFAGAGMLFVGSGYGQFGQAPGQRAARIPPEGEVMHRPPRIFAAIVLLVAIAFLYGGVRLLAVGGSLYYLLAGIALLVSAILLWGGNKLGSRIYGALLVATLLWSLLEVGTDLWALAPRLAFLSVLGAWLLTPFARRGLVLAATASRVARQRSKQIGRSGERAGGRRNLYRRFAQHGQRSAAAHYRKRTGIAAKSVRRMAALRQHDTRHTLRASRPDRRLERRWLARRSGTTAPVASGNSRRRRCRSATCCTCARR